jgi:hypothetical protein
MSSWAHSSYAQQNVTPIAIVHPFGFNQAGGNIQVRICVDSNPATGLEAATQWAVDLWTALAARTENCFRCRDFEEGDPNIATGLPYQLTSLLTHELGHCALALDHGNRMWQDDADPQYETTSWTLSYGDGAGGIHDPLPPDPADGIRGSFDDIHQINLGQIPDSVFWFRSTGASDPNNPVIVDSTVIDVNTYSRSVTTGLPASHNWSANANRRVAASLGHATTQSVLYSSQVRGLIYNGLAADDANMARMARTGVDRTAGTQDDYTVSLSVVSCQDPHEIRVRFLSLGASGPLGRCWSARDYSYAQNPANARDFELVVAAGQTQLEIEVNSDVPWDTALPFFADGFESANTDAWDGVSP